MAISPLTVEGSAVGTSCVHCGINPTQHLEVGGGFVTSTVSTDMKELKLCMSFFNV